MDKSIADVVAKQEITEVIYRVARATDRGDIELYASCFHEDGTDFHGLANGHVSNILAVLARSKLLLTQHAIANTLIDLDGDRARAESCFSSFHQSRDENGKLWDEAIRGRYLDRLERRADGPWKIVRRVVLWDWSRVEPSGDSWFDRMRMRPGADDRYIFGRRDRQDLLYTDTLPESFEIAHSTSCEVRPLERIFILDEIVVKPGQTEVYRRAYRSSYVPRAERRGMHLEGAWQSPPGCDYDELPATLYFLWSVEGVAGWWRMRLSRKEDGTDERFEKLKWWQESDSLTISRKRNLLTRLAEET